MKYRYNRYNCVLGVFICVLFSLFSCNEYIECNTDSNKYGEDNSLSRGIGKNDFYYWYNGKKIGLSSLNNVYYVSSQDSSEIARLCSSSRSAKSVINKSEYKKFNNCFWSIVNLNNSLEPNLDDIKITNNGDLYVAPVFGSTVNDCIATSEYFYVKIKDQNKGVLEDFAREQGALIVDSIRYVPNWYILKAPPISNGLLMSNIFYESGKFEDVDPAFIFNFNPSDIPQEPYLEMQWSLDKMNLFSAWDITKGNPDITVAIIDTGVDQNHREFKNNFSSLSYDVKNKTSPSVLRGNHGTMVGGIVGANHNGEDIAGVSPDCTILSISHSLAVSNLGSSELAEGIGYATVKGASVINNSWGDKNGSLYEYLHSKLLEDAITMAINNGRNGKGAVVIFAAGNMGVDGVDYPANFTPDILVVGSIDKNDNRSDFSSYGARLDVVAPGRGIITTFPDNGLQVDGGTSLSAPHVAGVAALILSINPYLSGREVVDIIENTSKKIGPYSYNEFSNRKNGKWNLEVGYGLCDAFAALMEANNRIVTFKDQNISSNTTISGQIIECENIDISNNAILNINVGNILTINAPFSVAAGSQLEIKPF